MLQAEVYERALRASKKIARRIVCRGQEAYYFHPLLKWKLFMK